MKLIAVVCLVGCLESTVSLHAQTITLSTRNAPLDSVFYEIRKQTGYNLFFTADLLQQTHKVTITLNKVPFRPALDSLFASQPVGYTIVGRTIVLVVKTAVTTSTGANAMNVIGKVISADGTPLTGASIRINGTLRGTSTNEAGEFSLGDDVVGTIEISYIGYVSQLVTLNHQKQLIICLKPESRSLDEIIATGYRTTTKKLMLATVTKISSKEIDNQPVNDVLAALQGRVPGMIITQTSGVPGSGFVVQIRGQRSIGMSPGKLPANSPLFIIDGVPFLGSSETLAQLQAGYLAPSTPFSTINPSDIESVEVLRDANSTSIYGSMGANGVVLITTRKPKPGKTTVDVNMYMGTGRMIKQTDYMNTKQYVEMRREALKNDGEPGQVSDPFAPGYAPDIHVWDTTRYTDWQKLLIGGPANVANAHIGLSGGSSRTQFLLGIGYNRETAVFPGDFHKTLSSVMLNVTHSTPNNKFRITMSSGYSTDKNNLLTRDLTPLVGTAPNSPPVRDAIGNLIFRENGIPFLNPFAFTIQPYTLLMERISGTVNASYNLLPSLVFKTTAGYTIINTDENWVVPIASQDPTLSPTGSANFGTGKNRSWIVEPQLEFNTLKSSNKNQVKALLGTTLREQTSKNGLTNAFGYVNDASLGSINGADSVHSVNDYKQYRLESLYGVISYNRQNRYLIECTGRVDGSSRFGPDKQFGKFGSVAAGWIFSNERAMQKFLPVLSFGKLRVSYGTSGNDQIGDYQYLDTWLSTQNSYQSPGVRPTKLFNASLQWEQQRNIDIGLSLGFLRNKVLFDMTWNQSHTGNQLLAYSLPTQTGFPSILKNTAALVQNRNLEAEVNLKIADKHFFKWSASMNVSIQRNKLLKFPGLDSTPYHLNYVIGEPLNLEWRYRTTGVDPTSGMYVMLNKSGVPSTNLNPDKDKVPVGTFNPRYFGGFQNTIQLYNFQLDFIFQFSKQKGLHALYSRSLAAGILNTNVPAELVNRWRNPGDEALYQRYTENGNSDAYINAYNHSVSDAAITNSSFIRLKNLSLSYYLPEKWMQHMKITRCRIYMQAQNLLTITPYKNADPESGSIYPQSLPPLRMITFGIQASL